MKAKAKKRRFPDTPPPFDLDDLKFTGDRRAAFLRLVAEELLAQQTGNLQGQAEIRFTLGGQLIADTEADE